jgi:hypothetical protein
LDYGQYEGHVKIARHGVPKTKGHGQVTTTQILPCRHTHRHTARRSLACIDRNHAGGLRMTKEQRTTGGAQANDGTDVQMSQPAACYSF